MKSLLVAGAVHNVYIGADRRIDGGGMIKGSETIFLRGGRTMGIDGRFDVRALVPLTAGLFALTLIHIFDHIRQGRELSAELHLLGTVSVAAAITVLILAIMRSDLARPAAFVLGAGNVIGLLAVHVAPNWWPLSDSYQDADVDALSWLIVIAMIVTGAALAVKAWSLTPPKISREEDESASASSRAATAEPEEAKQ